jgi:pyruvoyl-dependent arginine decarboxylase (PvlArgDC)
MSKHIHIWEIEQTTAAIAKGTCKVCKEEKTFNNTMEVALAKKQTWGWIAESSGKAKVKDPDAIAEEFAKDTYYVY